MPRDSTSAKRTSRATRTYAGRGRARWLGLGSSLLLGCVGMLLLATSCATPQSKDKWLRFFFDGVPTGEEPVGAQASDAKQKSIPTEEAGLRRPARPPVKKYYHDPYDEHECDACHVSGKSQQMIGTLLEVCFECHDDFTSGATSVHSPVEDGECLECHNPHESKYPTLLIRPRGALCTECHDDMTDAKVKHSPAEEGECLECHDPHASKNRTLLLRTGAATCYECHDDEVSDLEFQHDPAAEGDCTECHSPHASDQPFMLLEPGQALCYSCHDEEDIVAVKKHADMGEQDCTECHDPHGGDKKFFLK